MFSWDTFRDLFCQTHRAVRPLEGTLTYRPNIPENIFQECPCPLTEQNVFQWCEVWKRFVPNIFENIPSIIFTGRDPIVIDERKITSLDVALAKAAQQPLRYGSSDCEICLFTPEKRSRESFPATCVLLEELYIDCDVCIEGIPRIISVMPNRKNHHIGRLRLEDADLNKFFEMIFQLEGSGYECLITLDCLQLKATESLCELFKKTYHVNLVPNEHFEVERVLVWVSTGYLRQPSMYVMINDATLLRINRLPRVDTDAKHPLGYQRFTGEAVEFVP